MVDDFLGYTWVEFLHSKDETVQIIIDHILKTEKEAIIVFVYALRSHNGTEFRNATLYEFCRSKGISQ